MSAVISRPVILKANRRVAERVSLNLHSPPPQGGGGGGGVRKVRRGSVGRKGIIKKNSYTNF